MTGVCWAASSHGRRACGQRSPDSWSREIWEEAGIRTDPDSTRVVADQPWPFASSLMIGLIIEAVSVGITIDRHELEEARWFSRDEVRSMLTGDHPDVDLPPKIAIARRLLEVWAATG